ncbi:MAG: peptide ABC transporter substrate-binding protein [Candidatus Saccharimonadales bacterium]
MFKSRLQKIKEAQPTKRELKRHLRRIERLTLRHAHKFIIRRLANLRDVRKHAVNWLLLVTVLVVALVWQNGISAKHYTVDAPNEGGVYTEGIFGAVDNLNPIFASTPAERAGARLLFAQLLTYDKTGDLVGELAQSWQADESGKTYTVTLRPEARWQDGVAITADDVVFTFSAIKNANTKSPLYTSWRTIGVEKVNERTVRFTLPAPYAAFQNSLTVGILPKHVLGNEPLSELRTATFNRAPLVASGPFVFQDLRSLDLKQVHYLISLNANSSYVLGAPKLKSFHLHAYKDREELTKAFRSQEIASFSDASAAQLQTLAGTQHTAIKAPLYNGVYAFFKTDNAPLDDARVRQALQRATDQPAIIKRLNNHVQPLHGPLLSGQLGYSNDVVQPGVDTNRAAALLDEAGWVRGQDGKRSKDGQPLRFRLVSVSSGDYPVVVEELMKQWQKIGVEFDAQLIKAEDIQQNAILPRAYDILIYEIAIGRDPDVFAYWHSSQASERGLNLSNYKSPKVDDALDSARARLDPALREAKYRLFIQQWLADAPAVALFRPTLAYVQNKNVTTFDAHALVDPADRYFNVRYWSAGYDTLRPTR